MRTKKVKLFSTYFFCVLKTATFSTHMGFKQNPWQAIDIALPLHRQKGQENIEKLIGKRLIPFSKLGSSLRRIVRENQGRHQ